MARTGFCRQVCLLLWKNSRLYRRRPCTLALEILLPIFFALIMIYIRSRFERGITAVDEELPFELDTNTLSSISNLEIGYVPNYISTETLMNDVINQSAIQATARGFPDEDSLVSYYMANAKRMRLAVVFDGFPSEGTTVPTAARYTVRPAYDEIGFFTTRVFSYMQTNGPRKEQPGLSYQYSAIPLMTMVGKAFLRKWGGASSAPTLKLISQTMPYPPYYKDKMLASIQRVLPLFLVLSFILTVVQTTKAMILEKEKQIKESMKLMGLKSSALWAAWFLTTFIYLALSLAVYSILFGVKVSEKTGYILTYTDISLFYAFLLVYAVAIISFCFMISAIIQRANVGAAVSGIVFLGFYIPNFILTYEKLSLRTKLSYCLLFNMAMSFGARVISLYEGTGEGAKWSNFWTPAIVDDDFTLGHAMGMMLVDAFFHLLIAWYVDNVRPGKFGVPKPFYFCFTTSYWCRGSGQTDASSSLGSRGVSFEKDPTDLRAGIQISNLTKTFSSKTVVDRVRLNMYEGQITALLGHNGAGKTTTISMITGFIPPTSGTAIVNGFDICKDIEGVRSSLGFCPQHNIIWDTLTVEEHLRFFAKLKGCHPNSVTGEVLNIIQEVGLELKTDTLAKNLSGGQQRKLSVGIALIAGSKVVILDEPTSGMDPAARRQMWELLQRNRQGRTILLTTHYMDEADVLGDRIAIMAGGVVKCCGSSLFLKKLFGAGYHLVVVKDKSCKVSKLTGLVHSKIPNAELESEVSAEVTYILPDDQSANFPDLFRYLDKHKQDLGIMGFGISATTLEEVFLKVGHESFDDTLKKVTTATLESQSTSQALTSTSKGTFDWKPFQFGSPFKTKSASSVASAKADITKHSSTDFNVNNIMLFNSDFTKLTAQSLQWSQFHGMFVKKMLMFWRHRLISIMQLAMPVLFTILGLIRIDFHDAEKKLTFDLSPFGQTYVVCSNGTSPDSNTQGATTWYKGLFSGHRIKEVDLVTGYKSMRQYLLELAQILSTATYNKKVIVGAQFDPLINGTFKATAFYNMQPYHAMPISLTYLLNALAKYFHGSSYSFSLSMYPLPKHKGINEFGEEEEEGGDEARQVTYFEGFIVGVCVMFGMAFLSPTFVYLLVKEKQVGAKHLQVVSGVTPVIFWLATFLWDYLNYLLPSLAMLVVFAAYDTKAYVQDHHLWLVFLVLLLYGWAVLGFSYLVSFLFRSPASAMVILIVFNLVTGLATSITMSVLIMLDMKETTNITDWLFILLLPNYSMTTSFMNIYTNYLNIQMCKKLNYTVTCLVEPTGSCCNSYGGLCQSSCILFDEDYMTLKDPGIGRFLIAMAIQGFVFLALVLALDLRLFDKLKSIRSSDRFIPTNEDSDVAAERERVNRLQPGQPGSDPLMLVNLHKRYDNFTAVNHICVGVPEQECFGLLGQNGAGKTTTFKMLTGDVSVTSGNAYLDKYNIITQIKQVQQNLGYCPQFDALLDTMTGRETLRMYARLRGVPASHIEGVINHLIELLMLQDHKDKLAGRYSGGNKRKLSTAVALVGDPPFLLLDEPSTGVDPAARRQLWTVLSQVRASGRTLVLTSHSMEECDALCTRIAIMVNGAFCCLGSPQHLKNKFGQGYTLVVKMGLNLNGVLAPTRPVVDLVLRTFAGANVFDNVEGYMHFHVPQKSANVADVFELMERAKHDLNVEDYSVHQTTLEQVFLTFTRHQAVVKEPAKFSAIENLCCCCCMKADCYGQK